MVSLHFENGGLAFGQSLTGIFEMFHHDFLGKANKIRPCCREHDHIGGNTTILQG